MLTIAVAAEKRTVLNGYDIVSIVDDVDFVNVMSYDYHGSWDNKAGFNSPLYSRHDQELTVDWSLRLFLSLGVPLEKLIVRRLSNLTFDCSGQFVKIEDGHTVLRPIIYTSE